MSQTLAGHPGTTGIERVSREVYGQAVATLVRVFGDITLAEDAVQDERRGHRDLVTDYETIAAYVAQGRLTIVRDEAADFRCPILPNG